MIMTVYCVRDGLTGYMSPTLDTSDESSIRSFAHAVYRSDTIMTTFSKDYDLFAIGTFDTDSGLLAPIVPPRHLISGVNAYNLAKDGVVD